MVYNLIRGFDRILFIQLKKKDTLMFWSNNKE